jgi:hypothetical protein
MLFPGSTKPQTRVMSSAGLIQNEFGGGYVRLENGVAELVKFEKRSWNTDMRSFDAEAAV